LIGGNARIGSTVTVDLCRTGTALAGLAVPAHGEVGSLFGLDLVDDVQHYHAVGDLGMEGLERAVAVLMGAPDLERCVRHYDFCSSMTCFR
jgi:hypothetical protein